MRLKGGEAIVAATAWVIGESDKPIAPHLDQAAVGKILKTAKLDELVENVRMWRP